MKYPKARAKDFMRAMGLKRWRRRDELTIAILLNLHMNWIVRSKKKMRGFIFPLWSPFSLEENKRRE